MRYLGVDGCKAGWLAAGRKGPDLSEESAENRIKVQLYSDIEKLWQDNPGARLILIDMPLGLKETGPEERRCDREARSRLDKFKSSIFPVPCRQALKAESWEEANEINKRVRDKGLSKQSWHIAAKIAELDDFLASHPRAENIMRESHPELAFWALNRGSEMEHKKHEEAGLKERKKLLEEYIPSASQLAEKAAEEFSGSRVGSDDILDALALLAAALEGQQKDLVSLPAVAEYDPRGLRMEIVHPPLC